MKIYKQLFWILLFSYIGEVISHLMGSRIPGSVIGLILLFLALHFRILKMAQIETVGNFLKDNLAILFVPAGVAVMTYFDVLRDTWWILLIVLTVSTLLTWWFVAKFVQFLIHKNELADEKEVRQE